MPKHEASLRVSADYLAAGRHVVVGSHRTLRRHTLIAGCVSCRQPKHSGLSARGLLATHLSLGEKGRAPPRFGARYSLHGPLVPQRVDAPAERNAQHR